MDTSITSGMSKRERMRKTVGRIRIDTLKRYNFNFELYVAKRGPLNTGGKIFEESYTRSFNRKMKLNGSNLRIESTALLGRPQDSADLLLLDRDVVVAKIQQKLGAKEAKKALNKEKYVGCKILVPGDTLKEIKASLLKTSNKLTKGNKIIQEALESGRLTDNIGGITAKNTKYYIETGNRYLTYEHRQISKTLPEASVNPVRTVAPKIVPKFRYVKYAGTTLVVVGGLTDVALGGYNIRNTYQRYRNHSLDGDLATYKMICGGGQVALGATVLAGSGIAYLAAPAALVAAPVALVGAAVVIVAGGIIEIMNSKVEYWQQQRNQIREKLVNRMVSDEKYGTINRLLGKQLATL